MVLSSPNLESIEEDSYRVLKGVEAATSWSFGMGLWTKSIPLEDHKGQTVKHFLVPSCQNTSHSHFITGAIIFVEIIL